MRKILIALALIALLAGCTEAPQQNGTQNQNAQMQTVNIVVHNGDSETVYEKQIEANWHESLFAAMERNSVPIEYKNYSFGAMITGINGNTPRENEYIAIYIDGEYAKSGISDIRIDKDTNVEFRFESVRLPS